MKSTFSAVARLRGEVTVPGDKSISHRGVMFGSISEGITELTGFLSGADCVSTINCFRKMGIEITHEGDHVLVHGRGLKGLSKPENDLDAGNSGTTTRLMSGILSGQRFSSVIDGDSSLRSRPMKRIITPLTQMGADIASCHSGLSDHSDLLCHSERSEESLNGYLPLKINPAPTGFHGISYDSPVASAQVKSCILLAGLYADSPTTVNEPVISRDHTERMLSGFGATLHREGSSITIEPEPDLYGQQIAIPGDISSAAYFIAAGLIHPNAEILVKNVGINPTRDGMIRVAEAMGAKMTYENRRTVSGEDVADILVRSSLLHGTEVSGAIIPTMIDELPIIAVMAACASGETVIRDAAELKVKESDRIATVTENLSAMGADVTPTEDGMIIRGGKPLCGATIKTYMDHRIAMSFAIASLVASGETILDHPECVDISYPQFYTTLDSIKES